MRVKRGDLRCISPLEGSDFVLPSTRVTVSQDGMNRPVGADYGICGKGGGSCSPMTEDEARTTNRMLRMI